MSTCPRSDAMCSGARSIKSAARALTLTHSRAL
jgi:hypothetical protein